jgi:hypothetical protein
MNKAWVSGITLAVLLLACSPRVSALQKTWLDLAEDQARMNDGPGLVSDVIDYVSLRTTMQHEPDILRARIAACGSCKERGELQRQLAIAERNKQSLESIESMVGKAYGMDPWQAWKLGIKIRPDQVEKLPPLCVALFDRAFDCKVDHDNRSAGDFGGVCHAEDRLYQLCSAGEAKPFYDYAALLNKKARGELAVESPDNANFLYHNVPPGMAFPVQPVSQPLYTAYTDRNQPGTLRGLMISGMAMMGPDIELSQADAFRQPWRGIIHEDNVAVSKTARLIECSYLLPDTTQVHRFKFWYRQRPAGTEPARLSSRMAKHPLLRVGAPVNQCPIRIEQALALAPTRTKKELEVFYGDMLKQPGDHEAAPVVSPEEANRRRDAANERARLRGR